MNPTGPKTYKALNVRLDEHDVTIADLEKRLDKLENQLSESEVELVDTCDLCRAEFAGKAVPTREFRKHQED